MKHFKQIVSVMLTLLVIFSCCSSALAVAAEVQPEEKQYPIVYVTCFGTTNLYYADDPQALVPMKDAESKKNKTIFEDIIALIKHLISKVFDPIRKLFNKI